MGVFTLLRTALYWFLLELPRLKCPLRPQYRYHAYQSVRGSYTAIEASFVFLCSYWYVRRVRFSVRFYLSSSWRKYVRSCFLCSNWKKNVQSYFRHRVNYRATHNVRCTRTDRTVNSYTNRTIKIVNRILTYFVHRTTCTVPRTGTVCT